ncbi:MAG TPA: hypothetical protein VK166_12540 [Chitinophagaceae bacterium]|nr:hypothetical protein [Chitinophagaceae bacterium]
MIRKAILLLTVLVSSLSGVNAQQGCTDPAASNYDSTARINNGTCIYPNIKLNATLKFSLPKGLAENSGMIYWNNKIWIHNDGGNDPSLFEFDTTGKVSRRINIINATNMDWEDIAQDEKYVYVGDFGNNETGNRKNLRIYRVAKSDLQKSTTVKGEPIFFSYEDQTDFSYAGSGSTDFDCEAMIVINEKIYLFTKQWVSAGTALYELPATPGKHVAKKLGNLNVNGLVSGADYDPATKTIALIGYGVPLLNRFIYLLYDYKDAEFFSGNKRKLTLNVSKQSEAIAFRNRERLYISNENSFFGPQAVEAVDLSGIFKK